MPAAGPGGLVWRSCRAPRRGGGAAGEPPASAGAVSGEGGRQPPPRKGAPAGRQVEVEPQRVDPGRGVARPQRAPRLSWRWKSVTASSTGSISASIEVRRSSATMWAWPRSRQMPTRSRADPVDERCEAPSGCATALGAGEDRRQVLDRDRRRRAARRAATGRPASGPRTAARPRSGRVRQVARVVDDVRGADLGRIGEQPLRGAVSVANPEPEPGRCVDDRLQSRGAERRRQGRRREARRAGIREHRGRVARGPGPGRSRPPRRTSAAPAPPTSSLGTFRPSRSVAPVHSASSPSLECRRRPGP